MWRFVLRENIRRFRAQLAEETSPERREVLQALLEQAVAELNELEKASTSKLAGSDAALRLHAERAIDEAMKLHGAQFGVLQIFDEPLAGLIILAQKNFRPEFLRPFALIRLDDPASIAARCFNEARTIAVGDVHREALAAGRRDAAQQAGFAAVQSSPLRSSAGDVIGVLSTHFTDAQTFSDDEVRRMDRFAASVGPGLVERLASSAAG